MKNVSKILNIIFGWGIYICLFAGGLAFFGFLTALVMGGDSGQSLAEAIQKQYFPIVIRVASITIGLGLVCMYLGRETALSLKTDKKEADREMEKFHKKEMDGE